MTFEKIENLNMNKNSTLGPEDFGDLAVQIPSIETAFFVSSRALRAHFKNHVFTFPNFEKLRVLVSFFQKEVTSR